MTPKRLGRRTAGWVRRSVVIGAAAAILVGAAPEAPAPAITLAGPPLIVTAVAGPAPGAVLITWAKAQDGGSAVTTYGFSVSVNGGTTWSATKSFGSNRLAQSTALFPSFVCSNASPGSQGCLFRIYAANALGFGPPSKPVALWTSPSAPRAVDATATDVDFNSATVTWIRPTVDGGLTITGYEVFGSMDGAAAQLLTTVTTLRATVPCPAKSTCTYSVRAVNAHGKSPMSKTSTVTPAPGPVQALTLRNPGSDPATGQSLLDLTWTRSLTGLAVDRYDVELCGLRVGLPASCAATNPGWTEAGAVFPVTGVPLTASANCQAGYATCLMRVRAMNARGGVGPWRTIDLQPWAPFDVTVSGGKYPGTVWVHFRGPAESGHTGTGTKHYRVMVCETGCGATRNWRTVSDSVPYPPTGSAPYLAGLFSCRPPAVPSLQPASASGESRECRVRMQFVDGLGDASILSAAVIGNEHP